MKEILSLSFLILLHVFLSVDCSKLVAFTFGNGHGDSGKRQIESARLKNVHLTVIEEDGRVTTVDKLAALKDHVEALKEEKDSVVLFVESGGLFLNSSEEIVSTFEKLNSRLVISADSRCFPDVALKESYPEVSDSEKRFVNANGIIGYADTMALALQEETLTTITDLQYYFSKLFTNEGLRTKFNVRLDSKSTIFQNLEGSLDEVNIEHSKQGEGFLHNVLTGTFPLIVQPNGKRLSLNTYSNYLANTWDPVNGCKHCLKNRITFTNEKEDNYPFVTVAVFIDQPTPFINEFLSRVSLFSYPKSKINMRVSNLVPTHGPVIRSFMEEHKSQYHSFIYIDPVENNTSVDRRKKAMKSCENPKCDYLFIFDSLVQITKKDIIQSLMSYNKSIIAPLVSRRGQLWSNFWGGIGLDGYYSRSFDYLDIVNGKKIGLWNAPHIHSIALIKSDLLRKYDDFYSPLKPYQESEHDMLFSGNLRNRDQFMFVVNEDEYGYLVDADNTKTEHLHNDLWEIFSNPLDWEEKYIHENYSSVAHENFSMEDVSQPCPDVFWWPFVSKTFATQMIEEMEFFGQWSDGSNKDTRLEGGYENVPTRDIHMRQVGWEEHWMQVLKKYVYPMQLKVFKGYHDEPRARMNFVVRYKPTEQDRLRPHHDSASYTLNLALNKPGVDYEGGGAKFNRYKCAVIESKVGWVLMHPGRVTHIHEGLPTTKGTRYIFVTFVNP